MFRSERSLLVQVLYPDIPELHRPGLAAVMLDAEPAAEILLVLGFGNEGVVDEDLHLRALAMDLIPVPVVAFV